ncbi:hypothetical protein [Streptomyces sp. KN37]|uniref:EF-hand domain-containing protein n=1 Tax=Streptomyces sp. KN37 TaxID=3090667 RepID=UPI002A765E1E|nr:hypothetical protein [Streptomyces sp. KN37]WPO70503.1 hypothetical protein R9806_07650 [Streptomyces sp. KN37]
MRSRRRGASGCPRTSTSRRTARWATTRTAPDLLENLAKALFAVLDSDGDKRISSDEFAAYLAFRGVSGEDAPLVFQRLDLDRDSYLSQREIARSLRVFHLNNDGLHAPGGIFLGIH